jgi:galactokinase
MTPAPSTTDLARDPDALVERLVAAYPDADRAAARVVHAPGRVNLIGEHTDYNEGFVLPVAIDLGITLALVPTDDRRVDVTLVATGERDGFDLDSIGAKRSAWIDYVAGMAWSLIDAAQPVSGFRAVLASDLPQGSGLSSSAALELASSLALSGGRVPDIDRMLLARLAQRAENAYVGVNCGLMDQFASAFGEPGSALLLDCRTLEHRAVAMPLHDAAIVVCHSGSPRRLETSAYNERRAQCEAAVAVIAGVEPGVTALRDVTPETLEANRGRMDPLVAARAEHIVHENARVLEAVAAFEHGDLDEVGRLFAASHASMRDLFGISSPELDALVEIASALPGVYGARLTGAGFGGCTVNLVRRDAAPALRDAVLRDYGPRTGLVARVFEVEPSRGAAVVRGGRDDG